MRVSLTDIARLCQTTDMGQGVELETSIGYLLKEASSVLHAAMDAVLRPLDMTITQYSCLELLAQRPGLSSSDLARGAFVSRQSMNVLLQQMARDGLVSRAEQAPVGPGPADGRSRCWGASGWHARAPRSPRWSPG